MGRTEFPEVLDSGARSVERRRVRGNREPLAFDADAKEIGLCHRPLSHSQFVILHHLPERVHRLNEQFMDSLCTGRAPISMLDARGDLTGEQFPFEFGAPDIGRSSLRPQPAPPRGLDHLRDVRIGIGVAPVNESRLPVAAQVLDLEEHSRIWPQRRLPPQSFRCRHTPGARGEQRMSRKGLRYRVP